MVSRYAEPRARGVLPLLAISLERILTIPVYCRVRTARMEAVAP
jgi:hypothetical protein